jgi:hypothetical protein
LVAAKGPIRATALRGTVRGDGPTGVLTGQLASVSWSAQACTVPPCRRSDRGKERLEPGRVGRLRPSAFVARTDAVDRPESGLRGRAAAQPMCRAVHARVERDPETVSPPARAVTCQPALQGRSASSAACHRAGILPGGLRCRSAGPPCPGPHVADGSWSTPPSRKAKCPRPNHPWQRLNVDPCPPVAYTAASCTADPRPCWTRPAWPATPEWADGGPMKCAAEPRSADPVYCLMRAGSQRGLPGDPFDDPSAAIICCRCRAEISARWPSSSSRRLAQSSRFQISR